MLSLPRCLSGLSRSRAQASAGGPRRLPCAITQRFDSQNLKPHGLRFELGGQVYTRAIPAAAPGQRQLRHRFLAAFHVLLRNVT